MSGTLRRHLHAFTLYTGTWDLTSFSTLCALKFAFWLHNMVSHYKQC